MSKPGVALKTFGPTTENFGPTLSSAWNSKQLKPGRHSSHPPEPKMVQINMRRSSRSNSRVSSSAQQNLPRRSRKTPSPHLVLRRRWGRSLASAFIRAFSRRCPQAELSAQTPTGGGQWWQPEGLLPGAHWRKWWQIRCGICSGILSQVQGDQLTGERWWPGGPFPGPARSDPAATAKVGTRHPELRIRVLIFQLLIWFPFWSEQKTESSLSNFFF
jgi:hypothetical protein